MEQKPEKLIDKVRVNGEVVKLVEKDKEIGVKGIRSSEFVSSFGCILRGEWNNKNYHRNAIITASNIKTRFKCKKFSFK